MRGKGVKEKIKAGFGLGIKMLVVSVLTLLLLECGVRVILYFSLDHYLTQTLLPSNRRIMQRLYGFGLTHLLSINKFDPLCGFIPRQGFFRGDENIGIVKQPLLDSLKQNRPSDNVIIKELGINLELPETVPEPRLVNALNDILGMPDFFLTVSGQIDGSKLSAGIQALLRTGRTSKSSLSDQEIRRLNRALLEQFYTGAILPVRDNPVRVDCPKKKEIPEIRIICIGDSATYSVAVGYQDSWVYLLGKTLAAKYPNKKIRVLNAGVPGAVSRQIKRIFQLYLVDYQPDILIWRGGGVLTDTYFINRTTDFARFFLLRCLYESRLFRLISILLDREKNDKERGWFSSIFYEKLTQCATRCRKPSEGFDSDFSMVKKFAQEHGTKYVLQVERLTCNDRGAIHGELEDVGRGGDKDAVHTQAVFRQYIGENNLKDLFVDAVHLTEAGEAITAREISKFIINHKWIETFN